MTLRPIALALCLASPLAAPTVACAQTPPIAPPRVFRYALELTGTLGAGLVDFGGIDRGDEQSRTPVGLNFSLGVLFRSTHFASPFIDVGYTSLYASTNRVTLASGASTTADNHLDARWMTFGLAIDLWRVRAQLGVGLFDLGVDSTLDGSSINAHELDLGYVLALHGFILRAGRFKLGLAARALFVTEANLSDFSLLVSGTGDVLRW